MAAHRKVAEAVFCALPSTYDSMELPYAEAVQIGRKLLPEWMLARAQNPGSSVQIDVLCSMMARGFLVSAVYAIPGWLMSCWVVKSEELKGLGRDAVIDIIAGHVVGVDDAEKLARQWVMLAAGYTTEEAIEEDIASMGVGSEPRQPCTVFDRIAALEDM